MGKDRARPINKKLLITIVSIVSAVVVALAVGLGIGLGGKKAHTVTFLFTDGGGGATL